jgi:hypothetical protein
MATDSHVANIGERGARRRRGAGIVLSVLAAAALIVLLLLDAPSWSRLLVGIPAGLGAAEILQAREKT